MGFRRLMRYVSLRIVRVAHAPKPLARAIACGVAVSFFPIFGIHAFMAFALALVMKASPFAAAAATLVMPPVLLPLLFSLDFLVGRKILHYFGFYGVDRDGLLIEKAAAVTRHTTNFEDFVHHFSQFFLPAMIGAMIFMLLTWPAVYMAAHKLIIVLERRHKRHRAKERAKDANA